MRILSGHFAGLSFEWEGRTFTCTGTVPHTTRDGREVTLGVWDMECVVCGGLFTRAMTGDFDKVAKRCDPCRVAKKKPASSVSPASVSPRQSASVGRGKRADALLRKF